MRYALATFGSARPATWACKRNREVFRVVDDRSDYGTEELLTVSHLTGVTPRAEKDVNMFMAESLDGYKRCNQGDLVINTMWAWMGALGVTSHDGIVSPSYHVYRFRSPDSCEPRFFDYLFRTPAYVTEIIRNSRGVWTSRLRLYPEEFLDMEVWVPPLQIQEIIVAFLDRKTAAIDALIAKKRKLVELLAEKRAALINQAVTKGLDPTVPMKDSGIPWIGEIPAHWEVSRLGFLSRIGNGSTPDRSNAAFWTDGTIPWLNSGKVNDGIVRQADQFVTPEAVARCHLPLAPVGAIVVGITGEGQTRGRAALLELETTVSQHLAYVSLTTHRLQPKYLWRTLTAFYEWLRWESSGGGSTKAAITCAQLRDVPVLLPPLDEQTHILAHLGVRLSQTEKMRLAIETQISRLQEYRQALITAAVTGQLEIPVTEPEEVSV